jgi:hypothetical protein
VAPAATRRASGVLAAAQLTSSASHRGFPSHPKISGPAGAARSYARSSARHFVEVRNPLSTSFCGPALISIINSGFLLSSIYDNAILRDRLISITDHESS